MRCCFSARQSSMPALSGRKCGSSLRGHRERSVDEYERRASSHAESKLCVERNFLRVGGNQAGNGCHAIRTVMRDEETVTAGERPYMRETQQNGAPRQKATSTGALGRR